MKPDQVRQEFGIEEVRKESRSYKSRIYGFILFTKSDPYVIKVLSDDIFWDALDEKSGVNWPIFSVKPMQKGRLVAEGSTPNGIGMMLARWQEPSQNKQFIDFFGVSSKDLPCFITFIWGDDDELKTIVTPIVGRSENEVYNCIEGIVDTITQAEKNILEENKQTENVFREVSQDLEANQFRSNCSNFLKMVKEIKSFLGFLRL